MEKRALAVQKQQWYQTITTAKQSGQSIKSWCAENGVPLSSFRLFLQLAAKNEECIVAAGIRPVRGTFAQLAENSGGFSHPNHTAHSGCYS